MRPTAAESFPAAALDKDERWRLAGSELDTTVGTLSDSSLPTGPTIRGIAPKSTSDRTAQPSTVRATAASSERAQPKTTQASLASPPKMATAARAAAPTHVPDRSELLVRVATAADDGLGRPDDALLVRRGLKCLMSSAFLMRFGPFGATVRRTSGFTADRLRIRAGQPIDRGLLIGAPVGDGRVSAAHSLPRTLMCVKTRCIGASWPQPVHLHPRAQGASAGPSARLACSPHGDAARSRPGRNLP